MNINEALKKNKEWAEDQLEENILYFETLSKGQSPEILYLGCSDSRVSVEQFMGAQPGEIFVHRNIANTISNLDLSAMAVINYAVVHLKVKHIVLCGHTYCGGIKAALSNVDLGILNPWLKTIRDVYRIHKTELNGISDENDRYNRFIELNVVEQCTNLLKIKEVQQAIATRGLEIHGLVFDIASGKLKDLNVDISSIINNVDDIYRLD